MRQVGDGSGTALGEVTKFAILLFEISVESFQRLDRRITSIISPPG